MKSLENRWKHIKVADWSDFGWSTVKHYDSHPLADDSNNERRLREKLNTWLTNTSKEAVVGQKESAAGMILADPVAAENPSQSRLWHHPLLPQGQFRPHVLGPCFSCGGFGHLAKTCQKKSVYPFN